MSPQTQSYTSPVCIVLHILVNKASALCTLCVRILHLNLCLGHGVRLMALGVLPAHNKKFHANLSSAVAAVVVTTSAGCVQECKLEVCASGALLIAVAIFSSLCNSVALGSLWSAFCCWNPLGFGSAAHKVTLLSLQLRLALLFVVDHELCLKWWD